MLKRLIAVLTLCALLAGCASSGTDGTPAIDRDPLPEHPPFDYFTVSWYGTVHSRVYGEESELDYFMADELSLLAHGSFSEGRSWHHADPDWTLFENISDLKADRPIFQAALEMPDPTGDMQLEFVEAENESPWVKLVWSENCRVTPEGDIYPFGGHVPELMPEDTVQTIRQIAVFLESPEKEGRLDFVIFTQTPETGEYLYWDGHTNDELGVWFRQELAMYLRYSIGL